MPAGWTPKSSAPVAFTMGEALGALITGQPDSWLSDWLHLIPDVPMSTANLCSNVSFNPPPMTLSDFSALIPGGAPSLIGAGLASAQVMLGLQQKMAAYAAARIGSAYCVGPAPPPIAGWCPSVMVDMPTSQALGADGTWVMYFPPPGNTQIRMRLFSHDDPAGGFSARVDRLVGFPTITGGDTMAGFDATAAPTGWNTYDLAPPQYLRFLHYTYGHGVFEIQSNACGPATHDETPQPAIPGLPAPESRTYSSIPDVGKELDRQEHKLDLIRDLLTYLTNVTAPPAIHVAPALPVPTPPVDLTPPVPGVPPIPPDPSTYVIPLQQARGIIVILSAVPPQADERFGIPPKLHNVGRVTFGTTDAWFPPVDISENPLIVAPFPPYATRVVVTVEPPATATYTLLS